ncbi:MAG: hypothetical protein M1814_005657 [Vezdaea aestivalis]|nr:MAG: hypothetical protein M1814_005657 [Vezdaea aestivalis]
MARIFRLHRSPLAENGPSKSNMVSKVLKKVRKSGRVVLALVNAPAKTSTASQAEIISATAVTRTSAAATELFTTRVHVPTHVPHTSSPRQEVASISAPNECGPHNTEYAVVLYQNSTPPHNSEPKTLVHRPLTPLSRTRFLPLLPPPSIPLDQDLDTIVENAFDSRHFFDVAIGSSPPLEWGGRLGSYLTHLHSSSTTMTELEAPNLLIKDREHTGSEVSEDVLSSEQSIPLEEHEGIVRLITENHKKALQQVQGDYAEIQSELMLEMQNLSEVSESLAVAQRQSRVAESKFEKLRLAQLRIVEQYRNVTAENATYQEAISTSSGQVLNLQAQLKDIQARLDGYHASFAQRKEQEETAKAELIRRFKAELDVVVRQRDEQTILANQHGETILAQEKQSLEHLNWLERSNKARDAEQRWTEGLKDEMAKKDETMALQFDRYKKVVVRLKELEENEGEAQRCAEADAQYYEEEQDLAQETIESLQKMNSDLHEALQINDNSSDDPAVQALENQIEEHRVLLNKSRQLLETAMREIKLLRKAELRKNERISELKEERNEAIAEAEDVQQKAIFDQSTAHRLEDALHDLNEREDTILGLQNTLAGREQALATLKASVERQMAGPVNTNSWSKGEIDRLRRIVEEQRNKVTSRDLEISLLKNQVEDLHMKWSYASSIGPDASVDTLEEWKDRAITAERLAEGFKIDTGRLREELSVVRSLRGRDAETLNFKMDELKTTLLEKMRRIEDLNTSVTSLQAQKESFVRYTSLLDTSDEEDPRPRTDRMSYGQFQDLKELRTHHQKITEELGLANKAIEELRGTIGRQSEQLFYIQDSVKKGENIPNNHRLNRLQVRHAQLLDSHALLQETILSKPLQFLGRELSDGEKSNLTESEKENTGSASPNDDGPLTPDEKAILKDCQAAEFQLVKIWKSSELPSRVLDNDDESSGPEKWKEPMHDNEIYNDKDWPVLSPIEAAVAFPRHTAHDEEREEQMERDYLKIVQDPARVTAREASRLGRAFAGGEYPKPALERIYEQFGGVFGW